MSSSRNGMRGRASSSSSPSRRRRNDTDKEAAKLTVRGAPEHLRRNIVRAQNARSARRSREKRKAEYTRLFAKYHSYLKEIDYLENRVAALESILRKANVAVPENFISAVVEGVTTAQASVNGNLRSDNEPDNDQLFQEMLNILEGDR